ncbi:MAG TPA: hypothetical protein VG899_15760 [Mycobacteriales bacterium]|nr:hypothetical protein [Mycobacteriales bacterium]
MTQVAVNAGGTVLGGVILFVLGALGGLVKVHTAECLVIAGWVLVLATVAACQLQPESSLKWWSKTARLNRAGLVLAIASVVCFVVASQLGA